MALGFYFKPSGFTPDKYDETLSRLKAAGAGAPAGRRYHVALEADGLIQVFDVWESMESFEAFGATLVPIMAAESESTPARVTSCPSTTSSWAERSKSARFRWLQVSP